MRKLATIDIVEDVRKHPDADTLDIIIVRGWQIISKSGNFKIGDKAVVFEIDSVFEKDSVVGLSLPVDKATRVHTEEKGYVDEAFRIKTIKLRGQISQGYALPVTYFEGKGVDLDAEDLTTELNVLKYDKPESWSGPGAGRANTAGSFPTDYVKKTDQERCLSFDAQIQTELDGIKTIQEICETKYKGNVLSKDLITNSKVYKPVVDWSIQNSLEEDWLELETESGKKILVTPNHIVYNADKAEYVEAKELTIGDSLDLSY